MLILADPDRYIGSGNTIAMFVAAGICYGLWRAAVWYQDRYGDHSPTSTTPPPPREIGSSAPSRLTSHPNETPTPGEEKPWYGEVVRDAKGIGRRVYKTAAHIAKTGESPDPETDIPLDDPDADGSVPDDPRVVGSRRETREEYAAWLLAKRVQVADVVRALETHYGVSRPTAYRVVKECREGVDR